MDFTSDYTAQLQFNDASGLDLHHLCLLTSGRQILTVPSSVHVASIFCAQSTAPTSPIRPINSIPLRAGEMKGLQAFSTSNKKLFPWVPDPPQASHRPHGDTDRPT